MSDSQSHQMDQEMIIYQEEQVLWAKIRGYPWWPAFVDKVHGANSQQEIQYTVFFFGDNTHSRLGGSKLRRFIDFYTQFFPKAKTNRKLYLSIMKAQQKLKQNGGNIQIFEKLRNALKKPKKNKGNHRTQSKIGSQQPQIQQNQHLDIPQLGRNKTFPFKQEMKQQQSEQNQKQSLDIQKVPKRRGRKPKKQTKQQSEKEQQQQSKNQQENQQNINQHQNNQEQEQLSQSSVEQQKKSGYRTRLRRISKKEEKQIIKIQTKNEQNQQSQQKQEQQQQSQNEQKFQRQYPLRMKTKPIYRNMPKKRGRPKKVQQIQNSVQQSSEQNVQNSENQNELIQQKQKQIKQRQRPTGQNRKNRIQKTVKNGQITKNGIKQLSNKKMQVQQKQQQKQHPLKQLILERVKFCLNKRDQLIQYLDELNIMPNIIKDILDFDVTTIILEGETTLDSIRVLQKLKSVLLHKYFPDDIKIKKKYEKMSKKTQSRTTKVQQQQSLEDLQLRRKTIIKLQKILRNINSSIDQKQKAVQIQSHFRKYDEQIGNGYKTMAYKVLRSLKDKIQSIQQVVTKLQNCQFQDQDKDK